MKQISSTFPLVFFLLFMYCTPTFSQSPAPAPAPPGPTNVTAILEKAGRYTTFIRLLKTTQVADQLYRQLNSSDQGLTIFAPTDDAFTSLKPGMLNSLTDQQKDEMIQFHVLPSFFSVAQFQTASNPLRTQAGGTDFPLNVTTTGNQVNITTDMVNATVANTVYTDNQLAVYEVDHVLLPHGLFVPPPPAPAPLKPKKHPSSNSSAGSDTTTPINSSDRIRASQHALLVMSSIVLVFGTLRL